MSSEDEYVGLWVTEDRHIRHRLLPGGRYDEARGSRESAYTGDYWIDGDHIRYRDDTGFSADGAFRDGVLYHAGMVMRRVDQDPHHSGHTPRSNRTEPTEETR
ncbi:hypothetical protein GCM10027447_38340 [Glycomyces halotolerans]